MATVIKKLGIKRKSGHLYYINKDGGVSSFNRKTKKKTVVNKANVKKEKGYLYFLDGNGDISRSKMKRR